ncbi:MAG TPA: hypothetical protein VEZ40_13245 [Pyrinomonadaceae bacterium]|nr:hypothetical protein [Pyrinomonadaceae bacterium]
MERDTLKTAIAAVAGLYFLWCAADPRQWHLIDGVNLVIHEAGHVVFMPFGELLTVAGGSLFQVIVPAAFVVYFYRRGQAYSAALVLFWVGESLLNVSVYAGDALAMQLPLLGGEDSIHDWNHLLSATGRLSSTDKIAAAIRVAGTLAICAAGFFSLKYARRAGRATGEF